ncbi:SusC/RagA family TonB-linked outer membrane protein [Chryseobacterium sp. G0162]|uniref:SusC/RagA family TonB-linked outer membrane protein n=1 Tax=unclassified Chryseobacterium TaxID=2593645 RepID=UPI000F4DA4B7|nr:MULTISPECIES: SusC/RagA family TonB-linked outer membrane protein [unclassified Chryseobacterium]AZB10469.1 SusC/RagA family TonB-linked outer membrane protein [Chryseobacterium sp. G0162]
MNVKLHVLSAGALFFLGQAAYAQKSKNDSILKENKIDEVIVTGYQKKKADEITQAQAVVGGDEIRRNSPTTSIGNSLQGRASGVFVQSTTGQPGAAATIQVRGVAGVGGSSEPTYVVNGMYMTARQFSAINPADVESISILKDAAATAQYGARGANGVVVVTTKAGKVGKTHYSFETKFGFSERLKDNNYTMMNSRELMTFQNQLGYLGFKARPQDEMDRLAAFDHNWQKDLLKPSSIQSYLFSAQGGSRESTFYYSLGYDSDNGIIRDIDGLKRYTGNFGFTNKLSEKLNVGINLGVQYQVTQNFRDRNNTQNPFGAMYKYAPYEPIYNPDGSYNQTMRAGSNVVEQIRNYTLEDQRLRIPVTLFGEYKIIDGLKFKTNFNGLYDWYMGTSWLKKGSNLDLTVNGVPTGSLNKNSFYGFNYTWNNSINYKKSFGSHNFDFLGFIEYNDNFNETMNGGAYGLKSPVLNVPTITTPSDRNTFTGIKTRNTLFSLAGMINYDYAGKYLVTGSLRRDASSRFGANNQSGVFWSASAAWNIAKEDFMKGGFINDLKLRGSYGTTGNDGTLPDYYNVNNISYGLYGANGALYPGTSSQGNYIIGNTDLKWESNAITNVGVDFVMWKRRIRGSVEVYQNKRKDFVQLVPLDKQEGGLYQYVNAGDMSQKGLEAELSVDVIKKKDFQWNLHANISFQKSTLDKLAGGQTERNLGYTYLKVGETPYVFYNVRFAGVDPNNGNALYYDKAGNVTNVYSASNAVPLTDKSPFPKSFGGFGTTIQYKGLDFSADFAFKLGGYTYNNMYAAAVDPTLAVAGRNMAQAASNVWQKPGDTGVFQKVDSNGMRDSDQWIEKSDYLRLRSLTLGYTFDKAFLGEESPINKLRVYVQGQNLFTVTKFHGEPEVSVGSADSTSLFVPGSFNLYTYPAVRTILMGLQLEF